MQPELSHVASTVLSVFLVMSVGALARYLKLFTSEVDRSLAAFTAWVLMPALFFHRILTDPHLSMSIDAWIPALYGFAGTVGGFWIAGGIVRWLGPFFGLTTDSQRRTFALCAGIDNYGYIPLPLAAVFFPACIVSLMIHNVGVDAALWSVGLFLISGKGLRESWKRIVFSPPLLSVGLAVGLRQLQWEDWVPVPFVQMCDQLGRCSIPMALVLSGAIIYDYAGQFQWSRAWRPLLLAIGVRMVLLPALLLIAARWAGTLEMKQVLLLQAAMPAATFPIVMTRLYDQDLETAWTVVVGTSVISIVTIPLWLVFATTIVTGV
jgi:predicted permease